MLVVTLGLLVMAASLMVAVSRAALRHAQAARLAGEELQHRWGVISCRTAVLPYAESIMGIAEAERHAPLALAGGHIHLGGQTFELTIADELAKANVNLLLDHSDRNTAETRLRQGLAGSGLAMNVHLRPVAAPTAGSSSPTSKPAEAVGAPQFISGFGQVFDDPSAERLLSLRGGVRAIDLLTCWGGGQVNLRRVSPAALKIVAGSLTAIEQGRLLEARDAFYAGKPLPLPKGTVERDPIRRVLLAAQIDPKTARGLPAFTAGSTCHSLWITVHDKHRAWHYLSIVDETDKDRTRTMGFVW